MARVVVVGAGLGGLAAAARLARLRHDVVVLEQAAQVGGKLGWFFRDGFAFDTGPSLLTLPQALRDLFRKTGRPVEHVLDLVPLEPLAHYRFPDGSELDLPNTGRLAIGEALDAALGPPAGAQWTALMDRARAMWQASRGPFLESVRPTPLQLARRAATRPGDLLTLAPWSTLRGLGRAHLSDPRLRLMLERYATYAGSDPRRAPAALATIPFMEQAFGGWYVPGGLHRIARAVRERAESRGARVRLGARVSRIDVDGERVAGVTLADGERLRADVVVCNADASSLWRELVPRPPLAPRGVPSLAGFVMLLALRGRTPGLAHHTVLFGGDYDAEFDAIFGPGPRPVPDPTVYVSAPDDPALRPDEEHEAWFVLVNAPASGRVDWSAPGLAASYADEVLAVLAQRGLDVRDRLLWREVRTPADLERTTAAPGGAIYGTALHGPLAPLQRPANTTPVRGLFLVGGSAHPGGGLPLVMLSAAIVADLVGRA